MKNFEKVIRGLNDVSPNFHIGGSLSLFVFNYISRIPKDLDIQTNDEIFLAFAKEQQEKSSVPEDNRGRFKGFVNEASPTPTYGDLDPAYITDSKGNIRFKIGLTKDEFLDLQRRQRNPFSTYASFLFHDTKVEVYKNNVKKRYNVHGYKFVDPNEVLYRKAKYY